MNRSLDSSEFQKDLSVACDRAWDLYGTAQSKYHTVEDLKQDVMVRWTRWAPDFRGEASRRTVLWKIARNLVIDGLRAAKGWRHYHTEVDWDNVDIDTLKGTSGSEQELRILLDECLRKLRDEDRQLFDKCCLQKRSCAEIANQLGVTRQAVAKNLRQVLAKLRDCISR